MDETTISQGLPARADATATRTSILRRRLGRVATVGVATVLALVVWVIAVPVAGVQLTVGAGATAQTVAAPSVVFTGLAAGFAAWGVLALLERWLRHPSRVFAILGWAVLAVSLLGPPLTGASGAVLAVLLTMHVVTGATLIIGLPRAGRE